MATNTLQTLQEAINAQDKAAAIQEVSTLVAAEDLSSLRRSRLIEVRLAIRRRRFDIAAQKLAALDAPAPTFARCPLSDGWVVQSDRKLTPGRMIDVAKRDGTTRRVQVREMLGEDVDRQGRTVYLHTFNWRQQHVEPLPIDHSDNPYHPDYYKKHKPVRQMAGRDEGQGMER